MGFGFEELKLLWNTINDSALANKLPIVRSSTKVL